MSILGTRVVRTEDPRLLTTGGVYSDDLRVPELAEAAHVTFVRSPIAHAEITGIDSAAALAQPGVVAVLTASDIDDLPPPPPPPPDDGTPQEAPIPLGGAFAEPLLAVGRVRFVGEPVAMVITDGRYQGEDAAELVTVDYRPLPPVVGVDAALSGQTLLFPEAGTNIAVQRSPSFDDAPFAECDVVVERVISNQRLAPVPLEGRAAAAVWAGDRLTLWTSTQTAQVVRLVLARTFGTEPGDIRVIAPDVGGGFGAKIGAERDATAVAWAARRTGRPLRWVETRSENMIGMTHGRNQRQTIKIGGTRDGRILAYRLQIVQDTGAYPRLSGFLPMTTTLMAPGVYDIPHVQTSYQLVVTSTTPIAPYRGAGRPEATAAIERAIDLFAAEAGLDPADVRCRNFVPPGAFPYQTPTGPVYDSGRYTEAIEKVLAAAGYQDLRAEQARRRDAGGPCQLGIGVSAYVEITAANFAAGETARLVVNPDGSATVYTGSSAQGQGHHTAWAMLVQEELGIPMDQVTVKHGDTAEIPVGVGTFASRSLQIGGSAVHKAALEVKDTARKLAAQLLEASEADLVFDTARGAWHVTGDPATALSWEQVASGAGAGSLAADVSFVAEGPTFPFGAHLAVVEADVETGKVRLLRHISVDDAGTVINPVLAEGQRHGGIAQGAAQALLEEMVYDPEGNPLTSTLAEYAAITAAELPSFQLVSMETPTTRNPLGVKGIGESGTVGAAPAVQNAVIDAVSHLGVRHIDMPATPQRVWAAVSEAQKARNPL